MKSTINLSPEDFLTLLLELFVETEQKVNLFLFPKNSFHDLRNLNTLIAMPVTMSMITPITISYIWGYASGYAHDYIYIAMPLTINDNTHNDAQAHSYAPWLCVKVMPANYYYGNLYT